MPKTAAEVVSDKIVAEAKRLCPPALIRISQEAFGDYGADIYIYAPRKFADMLREKLKVTKINAIKGTKQEPDKIRILMDNIETMTEKAKSYFNQNGTGAAPAAPAAPPGAPVPQAK
jgi:hypothetical protein